MHPNDSILLQWFHSPESREKGYTAIIAKYQQPLYWHIRRLVIAHADADDVLQNVMLKAWKGLDNFREESHLYTWLYRIATNESISFLAKEKRRGMVNMDEELANSSAISQLQAEPHFNEAQIEWKLQLAIQQLPEKQRGQPVPGPVQRRGQPVRPVCVACTGQPRWSRGMGRLWQLVRLVASRFAVPQQHGCAEQCQLRGFSRVASSGSRTGRAAYRL